MPIAAPLLGVVGSVAGGLIASNAASKAAKTQSASADKATALQREMWLKNLEMQQPFYKAGLTGQNALLQYLGLGGDPNAANYGAGMKPFDASQLYEDPGYQFRLDEGLKALDRTAASRGGLLSGGAIKAGQRYAQDFASNEYTNAFNRYWNERNQLLNPLQSLLGQAQTTAQNLGTAGANYATNAGNAMMAGANARASGYVGGANALTNALSGAVNSYNQYNAQQQQPYGGQTWWGTPQSGYGFA